MDFAHIFPQPVYYFFNTVKFHRAELFHFSFHRPMLLILYLNTQVSHQRPPRFSPMFSSATVAVFHFAFKSIMHLELDCMKSILSVMTLFFFLHMDARFSATIF